MKILIFGGNGFLGNEIGNLFRKENIDFATVSRSNPLSNYTIDISNLYEFDVLPKDFFNVIINCATTLPGNSYLDKDYLDQIYKSNILGSQNICNWIKSQKSITKIINCSTLVVAKKPWPIGIDEQTSTYPSGSHVLYSSSKLMQELLFETFSNDNKIDLVQLRFSTIYGKNMAWSGIVCAFIDQARKNNQISLSNGNKVSADFLNVLDAARIVLATVQNQITGIVNAASGKEIFLNDLANIISGIFSNIAVNDNNSVIDIAENRAVINTDKLSKIIDLNTFINLKNGITKMLES